MAGSLNKTVAISAGTLAPAAARTRVAFLIPYFGTWPAWVKLFFLSCRANSCVTFLLVCEAPPPFELPSNIMVIGMERAEVKKRLERVTGLTLTNLSGHKLCDFRPFFSLAFADFLKPYEFWGFCDVDVMFGDLKKLLSDDFLDAIDVFTAHDVHFAGHFTILRNTDKVNRAGFKIGGWQKRCLAPTTQLLEERLFPKVVETEPTIRLVRSRPLPEELKSTFGKVGVTFDFKGCVAYSDKPDAPVVRWEKGKVYYTSGIGITTEVLYLHFMGLKRWWHWVGFKPGALPREAHYFSRLGYGCVKSPGQLRKFPWRQWYWIQSLLGGFKSTSGKLLRAILPMDAFLRLRRMIFGRSR